MIRNELNVQQRKAAFAKTFDKSDKRNFACVGFLAEHAFPEKDAAKSHAVKPADKPVALPTLDAMGVALAMWKPLTEAAGPFLAVLAVRSLASLVSLGYLRVRGAALTWPATRVGVSLLLGAAFLDAIGYVAYNVGLERSSLVLTAPLAAAHPLGTIALAMLIIRERPTLRQWVGISLTIAGVMVLSAVSGG